MATKNYFDGIGASKPLEMRPTGEAVILDEARGVLFYQRQGDSIRMHIIPGDGLPSYYFDVPKNAVHKMGGLMIGDEE